MATNTQTKTTGETRSVSVSFAGKLGDSETLTGTPTVTATPSGLTIGSATVSTDTLTVNNVEVGAGLVVQFSVSGGANSTTYTLDVVCGSSTGEILEGFCPLLVQNV